MAGLAARRGGIWLVIALVLIAAIRLTNQYGRAGAPTRPAAAGSPTVEREDRFPDGVDATVRLIVAGGPFPYERDGVVFGNYEHRLPDRPRGYYREYTVPTSGAPDRGARRIIAGGEPPSEFWYSGDHYGHFVRLEARP